MDERRRKGKRGPDDPTDQRAIEHRAVQLLSRREHSAHELSHKLEQKGFERDAVRAVVARLETRKWQSDARFADVFFRQRVQQGYGPLRIRAELQHKGVDEDQIQRVFEAEDVDWFALARERFQRRFPHPVDAADRRKEQARRMRYLTQRGFTGEQVRSALDSSREDPI